MAIEINNLETYLKEEEEIRLYDGNFIKIKKESFGKGPDHYCGGQTIKIKRKAYTKIEGKLTELGDACDIIYCSECNEGEQIE